MGQSSSTARHLPDTHSDHHDSDSTARETRTNEDMNRQAAELAGEADASPAGNNTSHNQPTIDAEDASHQATSLSNGYSAQMRSIQEEASEVDQTERDYRTAAIARMAARRQSTMSRLGSRILPNSVIRGLLNSQEETPAEGHAHRHGLVSRPPPRTESSGHSTGRFSPFGALGSRGITRRRSARGPPYLIPQRPGSSANSDGAIDDSSERLAEPSRASWRRSVRLNRMRHSISSPISHMFGPNGYANSYESRPQSLPGPPLSDSLPTPMDTRLDYTEPLHELDSVEPGVHPGPPNPFAPNPNLMRRLPGLLRTRSPRTLRREDQTPLSRVLQLAAAAIAAQLSGTNGPAMPNIHALGNQGLDGSLENFIQSLQSATSAQAQQPPASGNDSSNSGSEGASPPVNFLRVFRFANSESPVGPPPLNLNPDASENTGPQSDRMSVDEPTEGPEGRTVTLVVVGVRSVPSGNGGSSEQGSPGQGGGGGLDALLGLPFLPPNLPRPQEMRGDAEQSSDVRSRPPIPRSTGPSGLQTPGIPDPLRQSRINAPHRLSDTGVRPGGHSSYPPSGISESPPGPHPPPSTPADQGLSAVSSGTSTPSRRPSSTSSVLSPGILPQLNEDPTLQSTIEPTDESIPLPSAARQRRRSDSEYARHRALGSGNVRRNGVVEPDQPPPNGGRSWLIYVVGTNLSENHPALTTPSLFTDNPTYEDMILLSSLLGPVKPPVASQADVNSAGGLFRLVEYSGSLVAEPINGTGAIQLQDGERCLICLSDYEVLEEVRELSKCKHVFHRDCIDQWLTTGRNSCPLCRGQGVNETSEGVEPASSSGAPPAQTQEGTAI